MNKFSERRLTENEVVFRSVNQEAQEFASETLGDSYALPFYCECSNLKCRHRIKISAKEYREIHENDHRFIVKVGHEIPEIEKIIKRERSFIVVEKYGDPPSNEELREALKKIST